MPALRLMAVSLFTITMSALLAPAAGPPPKVVTPADLLKRAAEAAREIEDLTERATVLAFIGQAYHKLGDKAGADRAVNLALKTTEKIEEDIPLYMALLILVQVEARRGNADRAIKACEVMENKGRRAGLMQALFSELADLGQAKAVRKLAEAQKGELRSSGFAAAARGYAKAGQVLESRTILRELPESSRHYDVLLEIARAHARANQTDKARATLAEAWQLWVTTYGKVSNPSYASVALAKHAIVQAECGDAAGALETFARSKLEDDKGSHGSKAYYYWRLASSCVKAGDARAALKFAEGIKDVNDRFVTVAQVAKAQAEVKGQAGARDTLAKAWKLEVSLPPGPTRNGAYSSLAAVEALLGNTRAAFATARKAKEGTYRSTALHAVGQALLATDRPAAARAFAEAARELAGEGQGGRRTLPMTLRRLAEAGEPALALSLLDKEKSPTVKARGLFYIANGLLDAANREATKP